MAVLLGCSLSSSCSLALPMQVVVIDSSGSMGGTRMSKAKVPPHRCRCMCANVVVTAAHVHCCSMEQEAAQVVLATMNPEDTFNVVEFDTFASSLTVSPRA